MEGQDPNEIKIFSQPILGYVSAKLEHLQAFETDELKRKVRYQKQTKTCFGINSKPKIQTYFGLPSVNVLMPKFEEGTRK